MAAISVRIDTEPPSSSQPPDPIPRDGDEAERSSSEVFTTDQIELDDVDVALQGVLQTPCFEALDGARCSFMYTMQLTCSNVVSTVVTARIGRGDQLSTTSSSIQRVKDAARGGGSSAESSLARPNQEADPVSALASVYAPQSSQPRKAPRRRRAGATNGKYQAQLPAFRRSLPALPIPISRLNQELRQERDVFMKKLKHERQEKAALDAWAATKIQACFRGFRARPRAQAYATRQKLSSIASIRSELAGMQERLLRATAAAAAAGLTRDGDERPAENDAELGEQGQHVAGHASSPVSPWRKAVDDRAQRKREHKARREQAHRAATLVQSCARRFLTQVGYARLVARHLDEVYLRAVVKIQGVYRGYRLRSRIHEVVGRVQQRAALQIQCLVRGVQARERVCIMQFERKCQERRRAGLPLEFSLPTRTGRDPLQSSTVSTLRRLYEHRKSRANLEFRTPKWEHEQFYLHIHKVARKLFANQARFTSRFALLLTPTAAKQRLAPTGSGSSRNSARNPPKAALSRAASRLRSAASFVQVGVSMRQSVGGKHNASLWKDVPPSPPQPATKPSEAVDERVLDITAAIS